MHLKNQVIALSKVYEKAVGPRDPENQDLKAAIAAIDEIATLMGTKVERKSLEGELLMRTQEIEGESIEDLEKRRDKAIERLKVVEKKRNKAFKGLQVVGSKKSKE